ncbi:alpha/beta hydrolase [Leptospira langatensis]|uniref:Alpha/beta hydrolase n=1 Tax=Leptospira langatensis TaxID=2484983 RepID=A0A5F1ZNX2_9LEPT|nr:alpha/beta hydrolase [Leptospira langatensis]TGK05215.1 alpha/beta hydrolase [Leptospira langatensis]TGL38351.1 alpha/beta hydrolase [Leptospira langatensis]
MKTIRYFIGIAIISLVASCASAPFTLRENVPSFHSEPKEQGYAPINGIQLYYEVHGKEEGIPLVLLNGGGSTIEVSYGKVLPIFAKHRKVIALEEQAHGRSGDRNKPVRFDTSAEDVVSLLKYLKIEKVDILGFSNGASVGLEVAIRHPNLVRKLVFGSSITKRSGTPPQFWSIFKNPSFSEMPQPLKDAFLKVNPDPQKLKIMFEKDVDRMANFKDVSDQNVRSIKASTLVILGDQDIVRPEHAAELIRLIPKARLIILPGGHGEYLGESLSSPKPSRYPELSAALIEDFLDTP